MLTACPAALGLPSSSAALSSGLFLLQHGLLWDADPERCPCSIMGGPQAAVPPSEVHMPLLTQWVSSPHLLDPSLYTLKQESPVLCHPTMVVPSRFLPVVDLSLGLTRSGCDQLSGRWCHHPHAETWSPLATTAPCLQSAVLSVPSGPCSTQGRLPTKSHHAIRGPCCPLLPTWWWGPSGASWRNSRSEACIGL